MLQLQYLLRNTDQMTTIMRFTQMSINTMMRVNMQWLWWWLRFINQTLPRILCDIRRKQLVIWILDLTVYFKLIARISHTVYKRHKYLLMLSVNVKLINFKPSTEMTGKPEGGRRGGVCMWGAFLSYQSLGSPDPYFPRSNEEILFNSLQSQLSDTSLPPYFHTFSVPSQIFHVFICI